MLTAKSLKDYIKLRDQYISSFVGLSQNELPKTLLDMTERNLPALSTFDKDIRYKRYCSLYW